MTCDRCGAEVVERAGVLLNAGRVEIEVVREGAIGVLDDSGRMMRGRLAPAGERGRRWWRVSGHVPHAETCPHGERAASLGHRIGT